MLVASLVGCKPDESLPVASVDAVILLAPPRSEATIALWLADHAIAGASFEVEAGFGYPDLIPFDSSQVAVPGPTSLRLIDRTSGQSRVVGRRGAGPLEFQGIASVCAVGGDTLLVWDQVSRRVSLLGRGPRVISSFILPNGAVPRGACLGDGTFVSQSTRSDRKNRSRWLDVERHRVADGTSTTIAQMPVPALDLAFLAEPSVAGSGGIAYAAGGASSEVLVLPMARSERVLLRSNDPEERITRAQRERRMRVLDSMNPRFAAGDPRKFGGPVAETWPSIAMISVGRDSILWIKDYPRSTESPSRWVGYSVSGASVGAVVVPAPAASGGRIAIIRFLSRDTVVTLRTTPDGVRYVELRLLEAK